MRLIPAAFWISVVVMSTPGWARSLPLDQQAPPAAPSRPHIADDEWAMIESACRGQKLSHSHAAYMDCLSRQVKALEASPGKPSLASLTGEERATAEAACTNQRLHHGPAAYYDCLVKQRLIALTATPGKPSTPAQINDRPGNVGTPEAQPAPHPSPAGSRTSPPASGTSTQAAKRPDQPTPQDTAADQRSDTAPAPATSRAPTAASPPVVLFVAAAAIGTWLSWKVYRGFRGPRCAKCGHRFRGPGAYCPKCLADRQAGSRQAATQPRQAGERARADRWNRQRQPVEDESHERQHDQQPDSEPENEFDPYVVLGVARNASKEQIRAAYLRQMAKYHPDKVAHLGDDLQELAKLKAQAINRAYEELLPAI